MKTLSLMTRWVLAVVMTVGADLGGSLLPIPVAFSYPETGLGGGFKLRWQDPLDKPGFADLTTYATMRSQVHLDMEVVRDSLDGKWRLGGYAEFGRFPEQWFGRGNPPSQSKGDMYTPTYCGGRVSVGRWLEHGWLAGGAVELEQYDIRSDFKRSFVGLESPFRATPTGVDGGLIANLAVKLEVESRDLKENPRSGSFFSVQVQSSVPGTDFDWQDLLLEASRAASIGDFTGVVRTHHEEAWGSIPFWKTPFLGYRKSLRGLPDKRLRGNVAQCVGTEFRWNGPKIWVFPFQPAVFGELGRAGGHFEVWSAAMNWAAGLGVRSPLAGGKAVLRVDYGWSDVGQGLYVDFGQAF